MSILFSFTMYILIWFFSNSYSSPKEVHVLDLLLLLIMCGSCWTRTAPGWGRTGLDPCPASCTCGGLSAPPPWLWWFDFKPTSSRFSQPRTYFFLAKETKMHKFFKVEAYWLTKMADPSMNSWEKNKDGENIFRPLNSSKLTSKLGWKVLKDRHA